MQPKRIQRSRAKGWRLADHTTNPNGACCVTRPGKWGNKFKVGDPHPHPDENGRPIRDAKEAVELYGIHIGFLGMYECTGDDAKKELRGLDLACFCTLCPKHADGKPLGVECPDCKPCHADTLLTLSNA